MESIERRVAWVAVALAITLTFTVSGGYIGLNNTGTWELVFYIAGIVCVGVAAVLLVAALVPTAIHAFTPDERERLAFLAFALWGLAIVIVLGLAGHGAIEAHRHPGSFG